MDNAAIHKFKPLLNFLNEEKINYLYSAPYSFYVSPIETIFAIIKNRNWDSNNMNLSTK